MLGTLSIPIVASHPRHGRYCSVLSNSKQAEQKLDKDKAEKLARS
jgi:hypothetical protein